MVPGTSKDGSASKGLDLPRSLNTEKGSEDEDDLESVASGNSGSTHKSVKRQRSMDAFALRTSADQKARIDMQVARFFFGSNLPFRVVENNEFSKLQHLKEIVINKNLFSSQNFANQNAVLQLSKV